MLDTLNHCLHSQSTKHDERYFSLQDTICKFDQKHINNREIPINSHKEIIPIDKESINDNHENSNTQKGNQKSTKDEITSDAINKISLSSNQNSPVTSEQNITESGQGHNNKLPKSNESKSVKKKVSMRERGGGVVGGSSIIKHVKSYSLSKSLDGCKVYVKDSPGARVRCRQDYVRPTIR